ncbi:MAG: MoaF N-terminal domain-containing protein [Oscillospiraceae bacterium]|nr:MoaF N-terminal domain-containing protein [Oscillospiraceae bacterium]
MDMREFNQYGAGGIAQYDAPQNYELVGQTFDFSMDDGIDYTLRFIDKETVEWNFENEQPQKAVNYLCHKGDDTTYLVSYELAGAAMRTNHTWVIDLENWLVTRIIAIIGEHPKYEYLIKPKYEFGEIKREGVEPKIYPRHGYTNDLTGTIVQWFYGSEMTTVHVYYCSDYYRITYPPEKASSRTFNEALAKLPSSDEPTAYIKIKEGMYLFSLTEYNAEKIIGPAFGFRSNTMAFLQNYKRVTLTGRAFGTTMFDGNKNNLHISFGAFGKILQPTDEYILKLLTDPNPYIV